MKSGLVAAIGSLVLLAGTAGQAQNMPTDAPPAKPAVKEKKICRSDGDTGSIVPRRTCHTKAEWQAIDAQADTTSNAEAFHRNRPM